MAFNHFKEISTLVMVSSVSLFAKHCWDTNFSRVLSPQNWLIRGLECEGLLEADKVTLEVTNRKWQYVVAGEMCSNVVGIATFIGLGVLNFRNLVTASIILGSTSLATGWHPGCACVADVVLELMARFEKVRVLQLPKGLDD